MEIMMSGLGMLDARDGALDASHFLFNKHFMSVHLILITTP